MRKELRKICATTTAAAVLLSVTPIATPVAHAGWGSVIGGVIGGILNGGGSGGSNGGGNGGGAMGGLSNQQHAHLNPNDHEKLFMLAVDKNDIGTASDMLNAGVDINGVYPDGYTGQTALILAIRNRNYDMMQFLLENGANVNGYYSYKNHFISYMERITDAHGEIELLQFFINWGADVNCASDRKDGRKRYPIDNSTESHAWDNEDSAITQFLIDHGAYTENKDSDGRTPFLRVVSGRKIKLMNVLADGGADINAKDNRGQNALQIALDMNDLQLYKEVQDIMNRGQQPSQYQPSKPQTQYHTSENGGNAPGDDELVTFENKSNQGTTTNKQARLQEIHDVLEIVQEAEINENKGVNGLLKLMKTMDTMPINERVAKVNEVLVFLDKSLTQAEPSKLLPKLKDCTLEEQEIFSDALQIKKTRRERLVDGVRIYALERELTQEDLQKAVNLMSSSMELHENESESWKRVIEVCNR